MTIHRTKKFHRFFGLVATVLFVLTPFVGCATSRDGQQPLPSAYTNSNKSSSEISDNVTGKGEAENLQKALLAAKVDALKSYVRAFIGKENEEQNRNKLQQLVYSPASVGQFLLDDTLVITKRNSGGTQDVPTFGSEITITVNRPSLAKTLASLGLVVAADDSSSQRVTSQSTTTSTTEAPTITDKQREFIRKYVDRLSYLVYFGDKTNEKDAFLLTTAISQANSYLTSNGYTAIDAAQVEKLKKDKTRIYEEQTGGQISLIQWIAQSLNADVYLEIDASTTSDRGSGSYSAQAIVTIKMYETSTGQLLGSQPYSGPRTPSKIDETDAIANALQSAIYAVMPKVVEQSKTLLAKQFSNGIHYEVTLQKASDARVISNLRAKLKKLPNIAEVSTKSQNTDEVVFDVFYYGKADDLQDAILGLSGTVVGLENLDLVLSRGKTMTFTSGM